MGSVIDLKPLSRVEGHGSARIFLDGARVQRVALSLRESPRLFEALLVGKHWSEIPGIICRICSICSSVHLVTALMAIEKAFGVQVSAQTRLYRELIVNGGQIESHALHLFCLVLPEYFNAAGFADLARVMPEELKCGLAIKATGNLIQETVGGRLIHPVNIIPGGMGKALSPPQLDAIRLSLENSLNKIFTLRKLFEMPTFRSNALTTPCCMALTGESSPPLFGEYIRTSSGMTFHVDNYHYQITETVRSQSNAKAVTVDSTQVTVGALARLTIGNRLSSLAELMRLEFLDTFARPDIRANTLAQFVELISALERSLEIVTLLLNEPAGKDPVAPVIPRKNCGTAAMEAPRGTLIHSYKFDNNGICSAADIITPTAFNQAVMERDMLLLAREMEGAAEQVMKDRLEMLVRAYDPCISCAVHLVQVNSK